MQEKDILIGITTFNRKEILLKMASSLNKCQGIEKCNILIIDDGSEEYDKNFLKELFPNSTVYINDINIGSDYNIHKVFKYFLDTDKQVLFMLDSDLIFHKNFIEKGLKYINKTDGVLSLYNSFKHSYYSTLKIENEKFLLKKTIGSAGVVFHRDVMKNIIENVPPSRRYDWDWSYYLEDKGIRIFVTENSYIQHIGYFGYNTKSIINMDYGLNFTPTNQEDCLILESISEEVIKKCFLYNKELKNKYHLIIKDDIVGKTLTVLMRFKRFFLKMF